MAPGRIPPETWGPFFWHTMHIVALGYPNAPTYAEKRAAKEFFESLTHLIPCPTCKMHYADHIKANPITPSLDTRKDLFRWTIVIHNLVNKDLGKPQYTEGDSIAFYHRLGELGRSPVWTPEDVHAHTLANVAKYGGAAIAAAAVLGGLAYYFTSKE
jgi:hypothetical protein